MARRPVQKPIDTEALSEMLSAGLRQQIVRPNIFAYRPHAKQFKFHTSTKHTRLYIGGNRSGKTTGGAAEMVFWLRKDHPYRRLPLPEGPIRGRACAVDFNYGVAQILFPAIKQWMPPSALVNGSWEDSYNKELRELTLTNGSTLEFRSYDQDVEKFAGTSRHIIWEDEEPPLLIHNENMARLIDTNGYMMMTMTPLEGMTFVHDKIYIPGIEGHADIDVIEIDMTENPYLTQEAIDRFLDTLDEEERNAREHGQFMTVGGKIFKIFNEKIHVVEPYIPPLDWEWYVSIDHGYSNPTAMLWHAVSPTGKAVTFWEHYVAQMTVNKHAEFYHQYNKEFKRLPNFTVGDPAMNQRQGVTGTSIKQEYATHGVYVADANNDVASGINRMQQYLKELGSDNQPVWTITANCTNTIKEIKRLRWATYTSAKSQYDNNRKESVHKKDDHTFDSARYFFSFMPDLRPTERTAEDMNAVINQHAGLIDARVLAPVAGRTDSSTSDNHIRDASAWEFNYGFDNLT